MTNPDLESSGTTEAELDLDQRPGYLVTQLSRAIRARMDGALRPLALTVPQFVSLKILHDTPGTSGADLARKAFVTRQSMHELLAELRSRGWVEQQPSTYGKRRGAATLTPEGNELIEKAMPLVDEVEHAMLGALEDGERDYLADVLRRCEAALGDS